MPVGAEGLGAVFVVARSASLALAESSGTALRLGQGGEGALALPVAEVTGPAIVGGSIAEWATFRAFGAVSSKVAAAAALIAATARKVGKRTLPGPVAQVTVRLATSTIAS